MREINITQLTNEFARNIKEHALLAAMAFSAAYGLKSDDISELQAYRKYGRGWICDRRDRGQLHFHRAGAMQNSPKYYSVFEIECLKRAEKGIEREFLAALAEVRQEKAQKK